MGVDMVSTLPLASLVYAIRESSPVGIFIMAVILGLSIAAWSVMVNKFAELKRARRSTERFLYDFRDHPEPIALYLSKRPYSGCPLYAVYEQGCLAIGGELEDPPSELFGDRAGEGDRALGPRQLERVRNVVDRTVAQQAMGLEDNMGLLSTAVSTAPFLGLLGTVWGVMDAFTGMAIHGSAMLGAVAPGIASALLTTVFGLLVAIPSAVGYNILTQRVRRLAVELDNFAQEFLGEVQRAYLAE